MVYNPGPDIIATHKVLLSSRNIKAPFIESLSQEVSQPPVLFFAFAHAASTPFPFALLLFGFNCCLLGLLLCP